MMNLLFFSRENAFLSTIIGWMIASALGAETVFIAIQKYQIGHWCPVCLSIATSLVIAAIAYSFDYIKNLLLACSNYNRGEIMKSIKSGLKCIPFYILGLLLAFVGISKVDSAHAAVAEIKDQIVLGTKGSTIEIYFISDWYCPSCKKVESIIEKILPKVQSKVAFYFIDYPIHAKSQNFSPYNLSFLVNNKRNYFQARALLFELTETTDSPTDNDVEKAAHKANLTYQELPYLKVKSGLEYFDKVANKYDLSATPTLVAVNAKTQKFQKLEGTGEITEAKIMKAIEELSK